MISNTLCYMQEEHVDVLAGIPYLVLHNFWSKVVMPIWNLFFVAFGVSAYKINNPQSKDAYLMGSFFMIYRSIFSDIGTYSSVHDAIQEDADLGYLLKHKGYRVKMVKVGSLISALWSRDLITLWHGIGRTIVPIAVKNGFRVLKNLVIMFYMTMLPFLFLLLYLPNITYNHTSFSSISTEFRSDLTLLLNVLCCLLII